MRKTFALITVLMVGLLVLTSCSGKQSQKQVEETLQQYMQDVYAPESMKQFKEAKEDSKKLFTTNVIDRFFVSNTDELSESDKKRVCETYIYHGSAENQKDGRERYLVEAYLYSIKESEPIRKYFTFIMNQDGLVEDFTIADAI